MMIGITCMKIKDMGYIYPLFLIIKKKDETGDKIFQTNDWLPVRSVQRPQNLRLVFLLSFWYIISDNDI